MSVRTGTIRGAITGAVISVITGIVLAYQASLEGAGLQVTPDVPHPWLHGIAVNGLIVGVFVIPLAAIAGRWITELVTARRGQSEANGPKP